MSSSNSPGNSAQSKLIAEGVAQTLKQNSTAALATLIEAPANVLANVGSKLLVCETGMASSLGSLGDEALDRAAIAQAQKFLESRVDLRIVQVKEFAPELADLGEAKVLFERIQAEPRLVICGAGHVGAALAKLASQLGYRCTLIDDRKEFVTRASFPEPNIDLVAAGNWSEAVKEAVGKGQGVSLAIVTRGHSEDERCLQAAVDVEVDYIGLIGSKRRTNIVLQRLRESGAAEARLAKVHAPVGLDIGAVTPEEVALAIMAEIVAVRRGGTGTSLSAWRRPNREKGEEGKRETGLEGYE